MGEISTSFSLDEIKCINATIDQLHDEDLTLKGCMDFFMESLGEQIFFDKSDFMFFDYNSEMDLYEMKSFAPVNWTETETNHYIETYMHMDDVLPILSKPHEVAFRNTDIFSSERKKTRYYREFVRKAQLEISIDANIPLSIDCNTFAILGLFRNSGRKEFSLKELEIIKMYQKHLSKIFEKHLRRKLPEGDEEMFLAFDHFESLGICILDSGLEFSSFNTSFKKFASSPSISVRDSEISRQIRHIAGQLAALPPDKKMEPVSFEIDGNSFLAEISRCNQNTTKYICIVYPLSSFFSKRLTALKDSFRLSNREFEVLYLLLKNGMTNEEIANHLFISTATVKRHISTAYQKLGINNQKQLLTLLKIF